MFHYNNLKKKIFINVYTLYSRKYCLFIKSNENAMLLNDNMYKYVILKSFRKTVNKSIKTIQKIIKK